MVVKGKHGRYQVTVYGHAKMQTVWFHPGPWSSGDCGKQISFWTVPEGSWGISCRDFLILALLTARALIFDKLLRRNR